MKQTLIFAELQQYVVDATLDLFRTSGWRVVHSPAMDVDTAPRMVMAVIGYAAEGLRGALVLLADARVADALRPDVLRALPDEAVLRDVLGEFSNMIVGRLKNRMANRGVAPLLATPTTVFGEGMELPVPRSGLSAWHRFTGSTGDVFVRLDATLSEEFALTPQMDALEEPAAQGDVLFF